MKTSHPKEMYFLALTELCQRFAFWGIAYILVIYFVQNLRLSDQLADQLYGIFTGAAFILPILGGYIGDRFGYRLPLVWGVVSTALGCFLLMGGTFGLTIAALFFLAIGASIFTPSIYALLGSLYHDRHHLRDSGFSIYYAIVNIGAFSGVLLLGVFGQVNDWKGAFLLAGLVQLCALIPFRKALQNKAINTLAILGSKGAKTKNRTLHPHEKNRIFVIVILSVFSILFWMAYNQAGSSMNLFALRYTDRSVLGFEMPPSWLVSSETLYLLILSTPLAALYLYLVKKKIHISPQLKTALSLFAMGLCFLVMVLGASHIPSGAQSGSLSPFYLISAYGFMALGEMLLAPIGLALVTHLSPRRYTAMLVGVWYLCIGVAFYIGGALAPLMSTLENQSSFFMIFVVISFIAGFLLLFLIKKLEKMRHLSTL